VKDKHLIEVTNATLKEIRKYEVVTPSLYGSIFYDKADELNLLNFFTKEEIDSVENVISKVRDIQEKTSENAKNLTQNAKIAKEAIINKDNTSLEQIENNMDSLLSKIAKLQEEIYIDELTKVYNRKYLFEEILTDDLFKEGGTITFIDLDKFKIINDTYGHIIGDKVLIMIANMIKGCDKSSTIRYGGDEFIVVSQLSHARVDSFFKETSQKLSKKSFKHQGKIFKVGFSYGIEKYTKGESFNKVIERVDEKMYQQKKLRKEREKELA